MANNYVEFSVVVTVNEEEKKWIEHATRDLEQDPEAQELLTMDYDSQAVTDFLTEEPWRSGDSEVYDYDFTLDVVNVPANLGPAGQQSWSVFFYSDSYGNPDLVAELIRAFLAKFRPKECLAFEYAFTCDKPRPGNFGGGAFLVTAENITQFSTADWVTQQVKNRVTTR